MKKTEAYESWASDNPRLAWALESYPDMRIETLYVDKIAQGTGLSKGEQESLRFQADYLEARSRLKASEGKIEVPERGADVKDVPLLVCHVAEISEPTALDFLYASLLGWRGGFRLTDTRLIEQFKKSRPFRMNVSGRVSFVEGEFVELERVSFELEGG